MTSEHQVFVHNLLERSAELFPGKVALIHEDIRATFEQINSSANQLANWLLDQGIIQGDRVVLIFENCLEYVISYYAIMKTGAIAASLNTGLKPDSLRYLLKELEPKVIISSSKFERLLQVTDLTGSNVNIQSLIFNNPKQTWVSNCFEVFNWDDLINITLTPNPNIDIDETALASIIYTSGSTGTPKGVMLSHKNIVSNVYSICQYLNLTNRDIQMVVLPFFYVMGKSLLNTHFAVGGTIVINNKFAFPATVIKQMVKEKVTAFSGVPSSYAYLLHRSPLEQYRDKLEFLRYCSQAGGHMSRKIKEELRKALPSHTDIFIMYGATEASARLTYLDPAHYDEKIDSIGKPIPGVTISVLDKDGQNVSNGGIGELVGNGSNIMQGYWKDEKATRIVLDSHGYHTGDLGYQDKDGYFYVTGRKDNLLKVGGHRINPQEIEDVLMETELVLEAAVVGLPDELLGHRLAALVALKNGDSNEQQLLRNCSEKLPKHKLPNTIKLVRALPKSTNGKVDKAKCIELLRARAKLNSQR